MPSDVAACDLEITPTRNRRWRIAERLVCYNTVVLSWDVGCSQTYGFYSFAKPRWTSGGAFLLSAAMKFRRVHSQYDRVQGRAYLEARAAGNYGADIVVSAVFSFRPPSHLTDKSIEEEIKRQGHYALKAAAEAFKEQGA